MHRGDILTPQQLAERLQVPVSWIYEKTRNRGKYSGNGGRGQSQPLPVLRCGRYLRFHWPSVWSWLSDGGNSAGSPFETMREQT